PLRLHPQRLLRLISWRQLRRPWRRHRGAGGGPYPTGIARVTRHRGAASCRVFGTRPRWLPELRVRPYRCTSTPLLCAREMTKNTIKTYVLLAALGGLLV